MNSMDVVDEQGVQLDLEYERWRSFGAQQLGASWRRRPVTAAQRHALRMLGATVIPQRQGEASDLIGVRRRREARR